MPRAFAAGPSARSSVSRSTAGLTPEMNSLPALPASSSSSPVSSRIFPPVSTTIASVGDARSTRTHKLLPTNQAKPPSQSISSNAGQPGCAAKHGGQPAHVPATAGARGADARLSARSPRQGCRPPRSSPRARPKAASRRDRSPRPERRGVSAGRRRQGAATVARSRRGRDAAADQPVASERAA